MADFPVLSMSDWELLPPVNLSQKGSFLKLPSSYRNRLLTLRRHPIEARLFDAA
jgi:hypothetical protein